MKQCHLLENYKSHQIVHSDSVADTNYRGIMRRRWFLLLEWTLVYFDPTTWIQMTSHLTLTFTINTNPIFNNH
jgi:hypothetical protein